MKFISPTKGLVLFDDLLEEILFFIKSDPNANYKIIIGSDSHVRSNTCFVTAIVIQKVGKGAKYYYWKKNQRKISSLRQKIFYETNLSLQVAGKVDDYLNNKGFEKLNVEVHIDVGKKGDTKDFIKEVVGMVMGCGFDAKIKPYSYGASKVADRYTK